METRKLLTEDGTREWFERFGDPEKGLTFENVFGDMNLTTGDTWAYKVCENILFVKINVRYFDTFGCTACYEEMDQYMILPQVDMNLR
jgi:hypothetical protein